MTLLIQKKMVVKSCYMKADRKRVPVDDIFYKKRGSMAVFNVFTGYEIEEVKCDNLQYLFCFCVGDKWR